MVDILAAQYPLYSFQFIYSVSPDFGMHCLFPSLLSHSSKFVQCRNNAKTSLHAHTIHIWRCCFCYCYCLYVLESLVTKIAYLLFLRFFSVEICSSLFLLSECNVRTLACEQKNAYKPQQLQNTRIWCHWNWYTWILLLFLPRFFHSFWAWGWSISNERRKWEIETDK